MRWIVAALLVVACSRDDRGDAELKRQLAAAVAARGPSYRPHTRHLAADGSPRFTNRLILEASPYLIAHAHNPIDWFAWSEAAFAKAKREGKPVFLSIGYAACHWCHVMADESFEDLEVAQVLNRDFIAIKVDREARPDLDATYLAAVERMTGDGGWPLTVFLTPDRRAFFGATYLPKRQLLEVLARIHKVWRESPGEVSDVAARVAAEPARPALDVDASLIAKEVAALKAAYDPEWGGFGRGPKFPRTDALALLLRAGEREPVAHTLERMAAGGIHDQIGGGFHRYAVDGKWRVPHFEKMLYDQAQLAIAYLEAHQDIGRRDFAEFARDTLDFAMRELGDANGAYYAALDADSPGGEGAYYTWTADQIDAAVGSEAGAVVRQLLDVRAAGATVLWRPEAELLPVDVRTVLPKLLAARARRPPPPIDKKQIVAWNGQLISALARAAFVLDDARYLAAAKRAALAFPRPLPHYLFEGKAVGEPFLDDLAFFELGLLDLYEADPDPRWLDQAIALQQQLATSYADPTGGYAFTRTREPAREPDGNAAAALALLRLAELTGQDAYRQRAVATLHRHAAPLALAFHLGRPRQIVIVEPPGVAATELLAVVRTTFVPHAVLVRIVDGAAVPPPIAELVSGKRARGGVPTAYVCRGTTCDLPTSDPAVLARQLARRE